MNSNMGKELLPECIYSSKMLKLFMIATLISKFYWIKVLIKSGTSSDLILNGDSKSAIVPISSKANFFIFLSLSSSVSKAMGSRRRV